MSRLCVGVVVLAVAGVLTLSGCAGDAGSEPAGGTGTGLSTSATAAPDTPAATTENPAAVPRTLSFTADTVDGRRFDAATLAGKPVVLWFWAAWCPRCQAAADDVAAVERDFTGRAHVVGVAGLGSGDDAMRRFVADRGLGGFVNLADDAGQVWKRFEVTTQEYYVLLDAAGKVVHKGPLSAAALRDRVAALVG